MGISNLNSLNSFPLCYIFVLIVLIVIFGCYFVVLGVSAL